MADFFKGIIAIIFVLFVETAFAQQTVAQSQEQPTQLSIKTNVEAESQSATKVNEPLEVNEAQLEKIPEVGKHASINMDASSMILSLLMVLAVVVISALLLKRFNFVQQNTSQLKVVANLSLGAKERLVVVQVGEQQLVLGVTTQQITLIETLTEPLITSTHSSIPIASNVLAFLQKTNHQQTK